MELHLFMQRQDFLFVNILLGAKTGLNIFTHQFLNVGLLSHFQLLLTASSLLGFVGFLLLLFQLNSKGRLLPFRNIMQQSIFGYYMYIPLHILSWICPSLCKCLMLYSPPPIFTLFAHCVLNLWIYPSLCDRLLLCPPPVFSLAPPPVF